jgi:hypothetical protein
MASERQIAANRRNGQKSVGPRSESGKARSSRNAHRHGLAVPVFTVGLEAQLNDLARRFAEDSDDAKVLAQAEIAAYAQLDLERVRKVHATMLERALVKNTLGDRLPSNMEELVTQTGPREITREGLPSQPELVGPSIPLPEGDEGDRRFAEAIRHILPELTKICRYEKRAIGQRDRAVGKITKIRGQRKSSPLGGAKFT